MVKLEETNLKNYEPLKGKDLEDAIRYAKTQDLSLLPRFAHGYKYSNSENGFYEPPSCNVEWTTGFWTGELWLLYEMTGDETFRRTAEWQVEDFGDRIIDKIDVEHHDMGFLYSPSCVAAYKLTGNRRARTYALLAADNLISRFQEKGQFLQAWGKLGAKDNYRFIIDCLLNLPLLFWATDETGDEKYADIAKRHLNTAIHYVLREDDSTYHTFFFDPETGKPVKGVTAQGYKNDSAWARGQAWGVYGAAIAYRYLKDNVSKDVFERVTDFFLKHLPENCIPYWDFDFTDGSDEPRDSSSTAIAACGILEMARVMEDGDEKDRYIDMASRMARALYETCAVKDPKVSNGQLLHGTYARKSEFNTVTNRGVDECNPWGDYYYVELLMRLSKDWTPYW